MKTEAAAASGELLAAVRALEIALPPDGALAQDEEWAVVREGDEWRRVRLHDYAEVFTVQGLYEKWIYEALRCRSPQRIADLLARALLREGVEAASLRVLDLGAGNGCVAEELGRIGIGAFVGVDIIPEAAEAAERDRPGLYEDYLVCDLTALTPAQWARLDGLGCNALACVAALGFGDIPPAAFITAFNAIAEGGWVAFNIKLDFLEPDPNDPDDRSTFAGLIRRMARDRILDVAEEETYVHRVTGAGEELPYKAVIGRKRRDAPVG